ncbi:hypothetical protein [Streptomyces sp. NPDC088180]|uniref:hypothetical protein n=1 Tax=Streptomyces sp. NPDC088180 TaxID=3365837 RepID=UPI00382C6CBB
MFVFRELSHGYHEDGDEPWPVIGLGRVPVRVHGVGVYYRRFFGRDDDHFEAIRTEHAFQSLTESTKPGTAHHSGIYLTPVTRNGDELRFRLLRCSTNLSGPTESFRPTDRRMGSHSDQALDLADDSFIAVFSCYRHPEAGPPRKLILESKDTGDERFEIPLSHHGVVVFSADANRRLRHRIVLENPSGAADNLWLGVTFRTSKTFVRYRDGQAHLPRGARLTSADEEQRSEFYGLRRRENRETDFVYPPLTYTVSESDLMPPV